MIDSPKDHTDRASARDHLANERTFLAWLRTAISVISFGITINRFSIYLMQNADKRAASVETQAAWTGTERIGIALVIFGIVSLLMAALHFKRTHDRLAAGTYSPDLRIIWFTTIAVVTLGGFVTVWLFYS